MQHVIPANVNTNMRNAVCCIAHGALKEHQITGLCLFRRNLFADAVQACCTQPPGIVHARFCVYPADEAGAVKGRFRAGPAPHIGIADILLRFLHNAGELRVCRQRFLWNIVLPRLAQV